MFKYVFWFLLFFNGVFLTGGGGGGNCPPCPPASYGHVAAESRRKCTPSRKPLLPWMRSAQYSTVGLMRSKRKWGGKQRHKGPGERSQPRVDKASTFWETRCLHLDVFWKKSIQASENPSNWRPPSHLSWRIFSVKCAGGMTSCQLPSSLHMSSALPFVSPWSNLPTLALCTTRPCPLTMNHQMRNFPFEIYHASHSHPRWLWPKRTRNSCGIE